MLIITKIIIIVHSFNQTCFW